MFVVKNPYNHEIISEVPTFNADQVESSVKTAKKAQPAWQQVKPFERFEIVEKFNKILSANEEECAELLCKETGKAISQARGEVKATTSRINWFLNYSQDLMDTKTVHIGAGVEEKISYDPLGVIANISAWNFPYFVGSNVFIPALLTGNAVLYKPSEFSALTGLKIAQMWQEADLPEGVFQCITGLGATGQYLTSSSLDGMFFTGSVPTGYKIYEQWAQKNMAPVGMELGGKDPAYIMEDSDLQKVIPTLVDGAFYNCGQSCCSVERIYIHESLYEKALNLFIEESKKLKISNPTDPDCYFGAITRAQQIDVLEDQVREAKELGADILLEGGKIHETGNSFAPYVLANCHSEMKIMKEESFGPVIGIQKVKNDNEALKLMNDSRYGLTASVFGDNLEEGKKILKKLDFGTVYWNCCDRVSPYLPWSGRRDSGIGATLSHLGVQAFTKSKAWQIRH